MLWVVCGWHPRCVQLLTCKAACGKTTAQSPQLALTPDHHQTQPKATHCTQQGSLCITHVSSKGSSRRSCPVTPPNPPTTAKHDPSAHAHAAPVRAAHEAGRLTFFRHQQPGHGTSLPPAMTRAGCSQSTQQVCPSTKPIKQRAKTQLMYRRLHNNKQGHDACHPSRVLLEAWSTLQLTNRASLQLANHVRAACTPVDQQLLLLGGCAGMTLTS